MKWIIEHPEWQTPKQRLILGSITLLFWVLWFYLWIPVISVLAWVFGIKLFEYHMIELGGYQDLVELLGWYVAGIFLLGGSLIAWATYNIQRFKQVTRRGVRSEVTIENQARHFQVDVEALQVHRNSQLVEIEYNENLQITRVGSPQNPER